MKPCNIMNREMAGQGGSAGQPQLPTMPRDFTAPVECLGRDLAAVIAEAKAQGYHAHRMTVKDVAVYRLQFQRDASPVDPVQKL